MAVPRRTKGLTRALLAPAFAAGLGLVLGAAVAADKAGRFDYWVLSLTWSPQFCKSEPGKAQCKLPLGFVVHGLWPQYEDGYPDYCSERERVPGELVDRMLPLMPDEKLIQQQWRKHGTCSGMDMSEYFLNVERAWRRVVIPPEFMPDRDAYESSLQAIEKAFIGANPGFDRDSIALQCGGRWLREVRMCLDRDFQPRACGEDVTDQCRNKISVRPIRGRPQPLF
ncbi:MAG: ribonuclease T2 [Sinimarinibacterium sp.]|jgi:ribonuclease T2